LAKRAGAGLVFVWLCGVAGLGIWAIPAAIQLGLRADRLSLAGLGFMAGSGLLHIGYFSSLQESYRTGELSVVYPIARGTGPLLSVIAAIVILGEHASAPLLLGAALIIGAIVSLAQGAGTHGLRGRGARRAIGLAILTGAFTAAYTVWDSHAVTALHQPVIVYYWGAELVRATVLAAPVARRRAEIGPTWRRYRRAIVGIGILTPGAYVLVLVALTLAPVIVVAPVREVSIVFGVLIGANTLGEGNAARRAAAALAILAGIALIVVS
jgi:drug/metabolite transporter (DMT)-like permease